MDIRATRPRGTANAVLVSPKQIGSVTEATEAIEVCRKEGSGGYVVSHRSSETDDACLADFAVAIVGGQIQTGSACIANPPRFAGQAKATPCGRG